MKPLTVALALAVACAASPRLHATVILSADLPELVTGAETIVHGRVVGSEARAVPGRQSVETVVTVAADEYLKGDLGPRVSVRVPGGQIGFRRTLVIGAPVFRIGDQVVLFLKGRGSGLPWIVGLNQGVYRVRGEARALGKGRFSSELQVVEQEPADLVRGASTPASPLNVFKTRVRALVREGGAR